MVSGPEVVGRRSLAASDVQTFKCAACTSAGVVVGAGRRVRERGLARLKAWDAPLGMAQCRWIDVRFGHCSALHASGGEQIRLNRYELLWEGKHRPGAAGLLCCLDVRERIVHALHSPHSFLGEPLNFCSKKRPSIFEVSV